MARSKFCTLPFLLSLFVGGLLLGQKGASRLEGVVTDPSGGVVPGASVVALNEETGIGHEAVTNESGRYVFPALSVGVYTVTAEMPGFKKISVQDLKLDIAATVVQNFRLELGEVTETLTVSGQTTPVIQTTTSDIADSVSEMTIKQVPLNGRGPLELVQLLAGVAGNQQMSERGSAADQDVNYGGLGANAARAVYNAVLPGRSRYHELGVRHRVRCGDRDRHHTVGRCHRRIPGDFSQSYGRVREEFRHAH